MRTSTILLSAILCLTAHPPAMAQVSKRDLEGIERHKGIGQIIPILQTIEEASDSSWKTDPKIGTWDFLEPEDCIPDEEEKAENKIEAEKEESLVPFITETIQCRMMELPKELLVPYNDIIRSHVESYVVRHATALRGILGRYESWEETMRAAFRHRGLPEELSALCIVESAVNPIALSAAGARGMWQFMPGTARQYGLRCDAIVDERLDFFRSLDAATRYLKDAYARFGDWPLAISSYNCGALAVERAIEKAGSRDFWDIYPFLPKETHGYMPAFIAALYTIRFHKEHGIEKRDQPSEDTAIFIINRHISFREITFATGIARSELARLNPQFLSGIIPGTKDRGFNLRLPSQYARQFKEYFSN